MTIYQTNIAKDYALTAGFNSAWAGIREILQNALDGHDKGHYMRIEHGKARDRSGAWALKISNEGVALTRDALVLGFSTKRDDPNARGQHGEGLVVGINALLNFDHEVWIRTGTESWNFMHVSNESGLEVLVADIRQQVKKSGDFIVEIKGVTPEEWESYKERILFFGDKSDRRVSLERGTILLDPKYKNNLFVKGIYVCQLPDKYNFGYDLNIALNRDREVADPWLLQSTVKNILMEATEKNLFKVEEVLSVLENEACGESRAFEYAYFDGYNGNFHKLIAENFIEKYGGSAIPVTSIGDSQRVEHFGKKGITVSKAVKNIIEKHAGKLDDIISQSALNVKARYGWCDLDQEEKNNVTKAFGLVLSVEKWLSLDHLNIVDFAGETIKGSAEIKGGEIKQINLARKILKNKADLLLTLVHEVAHKYGGDGDNEHERQQLRILSEIGAQLM